MTSVPRRPVPTQNTKLMAWARAAGRCTFCNRIVSENVDLGEITSIGELAHIVGWADTSPRGKSDLNDDDRRATKNLILLCRTCHKPIDEDGVKGRYTVEVLNRMKDDHEKRIRFLTEIGADRTATIVRLVGEVRKVSPALTYDMVLGATTAAGYFPQLMAGSHRAEYDLDLRGIAAPGTVRYFETCAAQVDVLVDRINDGIRREDISQLMVFGIARIPILIYLGARLDDKISTLIFQRQRVDGENAWRWPAVPSEPSRFSFTRLSEGSDNLGVALIVNLSGTIANGELPPDLHQSHSVYVLSPVDPELPNPSLIDSPMALSNFERCLREFLSFVESTHGKIPSITLFGAIPVSAAVTMGRVLMPDVSPAWIVYDRDEKSKFFRALEVNR